MKHFQQLTFLKVLLPFVVGIFLAIYSNVPWPLPMGVALLAISLHFLIVKYANTKLKALPHKILGTLFSIAFIALGFYTVDTYRDTNSPLHFQNQQAKYYKIRVDEYPVLKFGQYRFKGKVKEVINEKGEVLPAQGNLLCYWSTSIQNVPQSGMDYWVSTSLRQIEAPKNPDEFNYKQYLSYYNIYYKCYIKDSLQIVKLPNKGSSVKMLASQMRLWTQGVYRKHLTDKKYYDLATALILGSKNELDEQITEDFSHTGTLHVLAVSGLHVGIIFLLLTFITKPLAKIKYGTYVQGIICLSGIWVFALLTGFSPSVQRAAIMFSLFSIAQISKVKGGGNQYLVGFSICHVGLQSFFNCQCWISIVVLCRFGNNAYSQTYL